MNVTLIDISKSKNTDSSSDDERSYMAFNIIIENFSKINLKVSETKFDNDELEVHVEEADHEQSLQDVYNDLCEEVDKLKNSTRSYTINLLLWKMKKKSH